MSATFIVELTVVKENQVDELGRPDLNDPNVVHPDLVPWDPR